MIQNKRYIFVGVIMMDGQLINFYKLEDIIMKVKLKGIEIFFIGKYLYMIICEQNKFVNYSEKSMKICVS